MDFDKFRKELNFISSNADIMKQTVIDWANINSGSKHLAGLAIMHQTLLTAFSCLGGTIQTIPSNPFEVVNKEGELTLQKTGALLVIEKRWESAQNRILLCGHMDTVFDKTDPFQAVIETEDNVLNGPGVADMKGGLVVMLYALKAFEQSPEAKNIGWKVVINADEEIGSLGSNAFLKKCAHEASLGLVYEPSMTPEGLFAGERKGSGKFSIVVTGIAAHAGRDFYQGRNAISHLSSLICEIQKLNDPKESLTINIGLISGGVALNVVPNKAVTHIDVRFKNPSDKKFFLNKLNELIDNYNNAEGFSVKLHGDFSRAEKPLTPQTLKLFQRLKKIAKAINLPVAWQPSGGCCDGNNLSEYGLAVVDTLGVRGGKIHSNQEYILTDSLVERSQLSALLLYSLARDFLI